MNSGGLVCVNCEKNHCLLYVVNHLATIWMAIFSKNGQQSIIV